MRTRLVLVLVALLCGLAAPPVLATPIVPPSVPVVYAHRGGAAHAPENTLAAFRRTHSLFADRGVGLELDVQATVDGHLVVIHDETLDRTTDCTGAVYQLTLAQLAPCNAAAKFPGGWPVPVPIPTLAEVLIEGRDAGWRLMVEIKGSSPTDGNFDATGTKITDPLVATVRQTGLPIDRLLVQSFWPLALERVERLAPDIGTVLLTTAQLPGAPENVGFLLVENATFATLRGYEVSAPDVRSFDLSKLTVDLAHQLGRRVVPWTIDDGATLVKLRGFGVDGVITNDPDLAYSVYQ